MASVVIPAMLAVSCGDSSSVVGSGPTSTVTTSEQPSALDRAVEAWEMAGVDRYSITISVEELPATGCVWRAVTIGADVSLRSIAEMDRPCDTLDVSVPALHRMLREHGGDADFSELGVPTRMSFVYDEAAGLASEVEVTFEDLRDPGPYEQVEVDLAAARARWDAAGMARYRLTASESRNYWGKGCTWTNHVVSGAVVEAAVGPQDNVYCTVTDMTVDTLHTQIERLLDAVAAYPSEEFGEHELRVAFDENGAPAFIAFDLANGSDEEMSLTIEIEPLP